MFPHPRVSSVSWNEKTFFPRPRLSLFSIFWSPVTRGAQSGDFTTGSGPGGRDLEIPWARRQDRMKTFMMCLILMSIRARLNESKRLFSFISLKLSQHVEWRKHILEQQRSRTRVQRSEVRNRLIIRLPQRNDDESFVHHHNFVTKGECYHIAQYMRYDMIKYEQCSQRKYETRKHLEILSMMKP